MPTPTPTPTPAPAPPPCPCDSGLKPNPSCDCATVKGLTIWTCELCGFDPQVDFCLYPATGRPGGYYNDGSNCCQPDVAGDGFRLTGFTGGVLFDLDADGRRGRQRTS